MTELMTSQLRALTIPPPGMGTFPEGPEKPWGMEGAGCRSIRPDVAWMRKAGD